jgi:hypothetical protein
MTEFPELPALLTLTTLRSVFRTDVPRHIDWQLPLPVPRTSTSNIEERATPGMARSF